MRHRLCQTNDTRKVQYSKPDLGCDWRRHAIARHGATLPPEAIHKLKTHAGSAPEQDKTSSAGPRQQQQSRIRLEFVQRCTAQARRKNKSPHTCRNILNMDGFAAHAAMIRGRCKTKTQIWAVIGAAAQSPDMARHYRQKQITI